MNRRRFAPKQKRSLGQVFLKVDWPVQRVVERLKRWKATRVLEIGPGPGILTWALIDAGFHVTAIEKDDALAERLGDLWRARSERSNGTLELVNEDVLKFDLESWLSQSSERTAIVGNIPYNISSPILMWMTPYIDRLVGSMLLVQLEFAQRLAGSAGTKAYGSLSVFLQLRAKVELDAVVNRNCFSPVPKVDSALVTMTPLKERLSADALAKVEVVTRTCFMQRRKMLRNALRSYLQDGEDLTPFDLERRPDSLSPQEYVALARRLFPEAFSD